IDWTKYCNRLVDVNADSKTALVEPGAVLDNVNRALARYRLMVGPKPSTHVSCTIGGMIGNNSCGSTAQAYGKMADSVRRLVVLGYPGIAQAADVVPQVTKHDPLAVEGLDDTLISLEREEHLAADALDALPEGSGWLMVQFGGASEREAKDKAHALIDDLRSA